MNPMVFMVIDGTLTIVFGAIVVTYAFLVYMLILVILISDASIKNADFSKVYKMTIPFLAVSIMFFLWEVLKKTL
jgi:hypothetical protein